MHYLMHFRINIFISDLNTCTFSPVSTDQRWWQVQIPHTTIESVAVSITPSSSQRFTIFIIELVEGRKALYKPCASFKVQIVDISLNQMSDVITKENRAQCQVRITKVIFAVKVSLIPFQCLQFGKLFVCKKLGIVYV